MVRTKLNKPGGKRKRVDDEAPRPKKTRTTRSDDKVVQGSDGAPVAAARKGKKNAQAEPDVASSTPEELSTIFTAAIKKFKTDLSTIELEDQSLPPQAFADTTDFDKAHTDDNLPAFLEAVTPNGAEALKTCSGKSGSPHTIVITGAAIRAQALLKTVRIYGTDRSKIAKLYAKHMKMKDHIAYVTKTNFGIGAGSPHRIQALIEEGVLHVDELQQIVIDATHVDEKQRTIFTDKDAFLPLLSLLNLDKVKLRLVAAKTRVVVF